MQSLQSVMGSRPPCRTSASGSPDADDKLLLQLPAASCQSPGRRCAGLSCELLLVSMSMPCAYVDLTTALRVSSRDCESEIQAQESLYASDVRCWVVTLLDVDVVETWPERSQQPRQSSSSLFISSSDITIHSNPSSSLPSNQKKKKQPRWLPTQMPREAVPTTTP